MRSRSSRARDFLYHVEIIPGILFDFFRENIQIEHALGKGIQKIGIVGNHDARFFESIKELRKVFNAGVIQIVRRFVEQEHVRILNDRVGKE